MISFDTSALAQISSEHGLSEAEISSQAAKIPDFLQKIESRRQGFYSDAVLKNQQLVQEITYFAQGARERYDDIVILGIGGSALGISTLKEAFGNMFTTNPPRVHVLDNIDPSFVQGCRGMLNLKKTLFLPITKSGGTPETLSQYFYFSQEVESAGLQITDHFVCITDPETGFLREEVQKKNIPSFAIPPDVGGRFSVLTPVGLLPAALMGINIEHLLQGAWKLRTKFLSEDFSENICFQLAAIQYLLAQKGKSMNVTFSYSQKLFRFADWYRQLLAESIGKKWNEQAQEVYTGITPLNALGVTDQHSQSQLYMEGPFDKFFIFLELEDFGTDIHIPLPAADDARINFLQDSSFAKLFHTEKNGTATALTANNRPHITIKIPKISEQYLGELFFLFEGATAFLGEFYGINAFDQPGVELSKNLTKEMLLQTKN